MSRESVYVPYANLRNFNGSILDQWRMSHAL